MAFFGIPVCIEDAIFFPAADASVTLCAPITERFAGAILENHYKCLNTWLHHQLTRIES
jgi:hypothetical protein